MPETIDPATPHSTKPAANPAYVGNSTHDANPAPCTRALSTSRWRRSTVSAQAPEGTSRTNPVTDQMTNSDDTCATDSPLSVNSRE